MLSVKCQFFLGLNVSRWYLYITTTLGDPWSQSINISIVLNQVVQNTITSWHWNTTHYPPFIRGICQSPVESSHKGPVMQSFDDKWLLAWTTSKAADCFRYNDTSMTSLILHVLQWFISAPRREFMASTMSTTSAIVQARNKLCCLILDTMIEIYD